MYYPGNDEETKTNAHSEDSPLEVGQALRWKRKASGSGNTGKQESSKARKSPERPQYCHWLMKSEPESRLENGIDVKVFYSA